MLNLRQKWHEGSTPSPSAMNANSDQKVKDEIQKVRKEKKDIVRKMIDKLIKGGQYEDSTYWFVYCLYYMEMLKILIDNFPTNKNNNLNLDPQKAIIVPYFYNFRHTLELLLKYIYISVENKPEQTHDIFKILKSISSKKIIKKSSNKTTTDELEKNINGIKELVETYFFNFYFFDKLKEGNFLLIDRQNEMFRYPNTNDVSISIDPLSIYDLGNDINTVEDIKSDFNKLREVFGFFVSILT